MSFFLLTLQQPERERKNKESKFGHAKNNNIVVAQEKSISRLINIGRKWEMEVKVKTSNAVQTIVT